MNLNQMIEALTSPTLKPKQDIVERLRDRHPPGTSPYEAADEIERLRNLLQNGSPVVEGTIQHMAMEIANLKKDAERYRWLREDSNSGPMAYSGNIYPMHLLLGEELDAAIDKAMEVK